MKCIFFFLLLLPPGAKAQWRNIRDTVIVTSQLKVLFHIQKVDTIYYGIADRKMKVKAFTSLSSPSFTGLYHYDSTAFNPGQRIFQIHAPVKASVFLNGVSILSQASVQAEVVKTMDVDDPNRFLFYHLESPFIVIHGDGDRFSLVYFKNDQPKVVSYPFSYVPKKAINNN